jgi:hypothetical protein
LVTFEQIERLAKLTATLKGEVMKKGILGFGLFGLIFALVFCFVGCDWLQDQKKDEKACFVWPELKLMDKESCKFEFWVYKSDGCKDVAYYRIESGFGNWANVHPTAFPIYVTLYGNQKYFVSVTAYFQDGTYEAFGEELSPECSASDPGDGDGDGGDLNIELSAGESPDGGEYCHRIIITITGGTPPYFPYFMNPGDDDWTSDSKSCDGTCNTDSNDGTDWRVVDNDGNKSDVETWRFPDGCV